MEPVSYTHLDVYKRQLLIFRVVNSERLGMLLQTAREDEAFAEATGIDYRRARLHVFLIVSAGLGVIGAFYAQFYGCLLYTSRCV